MTNTNQQFGQTTPSGRSVQFNASGPIAQILSLLILIILIVVGVIVGIAILIPIAIIGLILFVYFKIKRAFKKTQAPNGPLDGRRNVRVMNRDE